LKIRSQEQGRWGQAWDNCEGGREKGGRVLKYVKEPMQFCSELGQKNGKISVAGRGREKRLIILRWERGGGGRSTACKGLEVDYYQRRGK